MYQTYASIQNTLDILCYMYLYDVHISLNTQLLHRLNLCNGGMKFISFKQLIYNVQAWILFTTPISDQLHYTRTYR